MNLSGFEFRPGQPSSFTVKMAKQILSVPSDQFFIFWSLFFLSTSILKGQEFKYVFVQSEDLFKIMHLDSTGVSDDTITLYFILLKDETPSFYQNGSEFYAITRIPCGSKMRYIIYNYIFHESTIRLKDVYNFYESDRRVFYYSHIIQGFNSASIVFEYNNKIEILLNITPQTNISNEIENEYLTNKRKILSDVEKIIIKRGH